MSQERTGTGRNPNRNLWDNNGTWWIHYTIYPTPLTKQRVRCSLRTKSVIEARQRRDALFLMLQTPGQGSTEAVELELAA